MLNLQLILLHQAWDKEYFDEFGIEEDLNDIDLIIVPSITVSRIPDL